MTRLALLGTCLLLPGCLQPVGFPWSDGASTSTGDASTGTGEPTSSTSGATTTTSTSSTTATSTGTSTSTTEPSTTTTTTSSSSTGSTGPVAICGDGHVDPDEDCDDANDIDTDGCNQQCGRDRLIFVTSSTYSGDLIKGLAGGDEICRDAAQKGGLPNALSFQAWLSDSVTSAIDRLPHHKGRYVRVDGLVVANGFDDLLDGELENPIVITEVDGVYEYGVWTGTRPDGTRGKGANHCEDWTFADAFDPQNGGFYGFAISWDERWTYEPKADINPTFCGGELAIYCIEG